MDKGIICKDCNKIFKLTEGEVSFYTDNFSDKGNLMPLPKRCKECRKKRKNDT